MTVAEAYPAGRASSAAPRMAGQLPPRLCGSVAAVRRWPAPVGVANRWQASQWNGPADGRRRAPARASPYDPSVMPSSMIPAQTALAGRPGATSPA